LLALIGSVGGIGGSVLATIVAGGHYYGFPGWRLAFISVAFVSFLIGLLVYLYAVDPRKISPSHFGGDDDNERYGLLILGGKILTSLFLF
jgi:MFS family permease